MIRLKSTHIVLIFSVVFLFTWLSSHETIQAGDSRPNIVWIIVEDMSTPFGCYGETTIQTPHVDQLARDGVLFENAFVTAPVCSAARSALITGMYQTSIGSHHHRSGRGTAKIHLPEHVSLVPDLFHQAGYYVTNAGFSKKRKELRTGKTDYNFEYSSSLYDGSDWTKRKKDQPFFAQYQLHGGKGRTDEANHPVDPKDIKLPPYYPNDPVILDDWAMYLNSAQNTDDEVGMIIQALKEQGVLENTYVFFITDHGISHARGKQFLYDEGTRIPFIVRGPGLKPGTVREDLIVHIDMAAASLDLAGIELPANLDSRPLFSSDYKARDYVVSARDRCDETVDHLRSVRTIQFKYIKNYLPHRPYLQPNAYKDHKEIIIAMRRLHKENRLNAVQSLIMAETRPEEELYDLQADPYELNNLAENPKYRKTLEEMRASLDHWIRETGDKGIKPESAEMYDSDMKVYLDNILSRSRSAGDEQSKRAKILQSNIDLMKQWQSEGR